MSKCALPAPDYLWISPTGTAYPGYHHQLILHLLARDEEWLQPVVDLNKIKTHLVTNYADYMMDDISLEAIGREYLQLDRVAQTAYRHVDPIVQPYSTRYNDSMPYEVDVKELKTETESVIDPALFESEASSPIPPKFSSPPPFLSDSTAGTTYSDKESLKLIDRSRSAKDLEHESFTRLYSTASHGSKRSFRVVKSKSRLSIPHSVRTKFQPILASSPLSSGRLIDQDNLVPTVPPTRSTGAPDDIPTHTGSIAKDVGQILFYAQNVHKARQENRSTTNMSSKPVLEIVDGASIDTSEMRLPDPTKYFQTSRNHFTIPASEAEAFCHVSQLLDLVSIFSRPFPFISSVNIGSYANSPSGSNQPSILSPIESKATSGTVMLVSNPRIQLVQA